jgi:ubiquinone/menaquinone biosynthesis C-methylase UbiE
MGWLFSALYDRAMRSAEEATLGAWRQELLAGTSGAVLEIGAGTGANVSSYPPAVSRLVLAEPDDHMRARLEARIQGAGVPHVELCAAPAERLPFPDASFDYVVTTLVLCSVHDPTATLAEIRRVLVPNGALVYLEHVAADEKPRRLVWQERVEPLWKRLAGNCHLTRRTSALIRDAGFTIEREERASARKTFVLVRTMVRGTARSVAPAR